MRKQFRKAENIIATLFLSLVIASLFIVAFLMISSSIRKRSLGRMEEGVNTVIAEVQTKLKRESQILNSTADIISAANNFDVEDTLEIVNQISPILETMQIRVLLSNNQILLHDGTVTEITDLGFLDFQKEAALGEHISDRVVSASGEPALRHFVPVYQNGEIVALIFGVTYLNTLADSINIQNIYNASANVYIVDTKTGDYIMDTTHDALGNLYDDDKLNRETKGAEDWAAYQDELMSLRSGHVIYRPESGQDWEYLYYAPAGINDWSIAVSVPEREAFANVYVVRNICILIGVLLVAALLVYYFVIFRSWKRTVRESVDHAVLEERLKKAEAAERAKSVFLSNMSHDIRTPMNAIIGFTTLAEKNIDDKARVQDYHAKILSSSQHLLSLINDILDMSRIESGKLNIEEKPCSISEIFKDMRNILQMQMQAKDLDFFMESLDVEDEQIFCDKLHVNQVLLNLLSNAIKFTPSGGTVSLIIRQKPGAPDGYGTYEIRVKDTGIGMEKEFVKHIFEPFERERTSTVSGIQGTGLGMAITKNIVDTMGGTISVETEPGKGTEFIVTFTFRLQSVEKESNYIKELSGMRALVVDDSFDTCDSAAKMLTKIGMRPEWTMRGKEAILRIRQAQEMGDEFYTYIVDWTLPDIGGLELVRQIRSIAGQQVPIIVITAYDRSAFEEEAKAAGATAFCSKPMFISDLREILLASMGGSELAVVSQQIPDALEDMKGTRLLLVEDNELNREIAQELLKENGFLIETAVNGKEAVEMVRDSAPGYYALILMDVQMPVMDGYEASKAIRALEDKTLASIPIIAMTANAFMEDRKRAIESGMNDHVPKPINTENLIRVISSCFGNGPG